MGRQREGEGEGTGSKRESRGGEESAGRVVPSRFKPQYLKKSN